jgi:uncharacterized membrane protein
MPKISIVETTILKAAGSEPFWLVKFEYPDLDTKTFGFDTKADAENAISLARYIMSNDLSLANINYEEEK